MALSAYERTVRRFRADLLRDEGATRSQLAAAYRASLRSIERGIAEASQQFAGMEPEPMVDRRGRFTDRGQVEWRRDRLRALERQIEDELIRLTDESATLIADGQRRMTRLGPEQAAGLVEAQAPDLSASFTQLPAQAFESMVGATETGPLRDLLGRYGAVAASDASDVLRDAIAQGWGPRETGRRLRKVLGVAQWKAEQLARDQQIRAFRESSLDTYRANADILRGYRRRATLSARTCSPCLALDGRFYPLNEAMSSHVCCRCYLEPLLRDPYAPPPIVETGAEWFDRQDELTQRRILGPGKARLYQAGEITLSDLVAEWFDAMWGPQIGEVPLREVIERGRRAA